MKMKISTGSVWILLISCSALAGSNDPEDGASWLTIYNDIFGPSEDNSSPMTTRELMDAMNYLYTAAVKLELIDKDKRETVDLWYDLIYGPNEMDPDNCTLAYLKDMAEKYMQQNVGINVNFNRLYQQFRKKLIIFCNSHFRDLPDMLTSIVPVSVAENLLAIDPQAYSRDSGDVLRTAILNSGEYYLREEDPGEEELLNNWKSQPCELLIAKLEQPEMEKYVNLIDLLTETRDLEDLCARSILFWVKVVERCKSLHSLVPTIAHNYRIERGAENMWDRTYNDMFAGKKVSAYIRTSREIKAAMKALYVGSHIPTDEKGKEIVRIWYEALTKFEIENCNVPFLEKMSKLYREQNVKNNANFKQLYMDVRKNAIEQCDKHFSDLHSRLASRIWNKKLLDLLESDKPGSEMTSASTYFDPVLAETLAEPVVRMVENGDRGANVMNVWKRSTCAEVQAFLSEPDMRQYSDFVDMSLFGKREFLHCCSKPNQLWARVVDACKYLDRWIPKIAEDKALAKNVRTNIRTLMMV